jgi:hypothetical protein
MFTLKVLHHKAEAKRTDKSYTNPYRNIVHPRAGDWVWEIGDWESSIKHRYGHLQSAIRNRTRRKHNYEHERPGIL